MNAQAPRFPLFDSMRAIAALSVVLFHVAFYARGLQTEFPGRLLGQLNVGVTIFFVISGFLLYRPFVQARLEGAPRPALLPYGIRRFMRIVPAFWVAIVLIGLLLPLHDVFTSRGVVTYFGFAQVYSHARLGEVVLHGVLGQTWTLCVEVTFYALLPILAMALRRLPGRSPRQLVVSEGLLLLGIFLVGVGWSLTQIGSERGAWQFNPASATLPYYLDHFAIGMALAVASVALAGRPRQPLAVRVVERSPWVPWLVAAAAYVLLAEIGDTFNSFGAEPARHALRGLIALGLLLPAIFGGDRGGAVRRVLADRRLQWVGLISYSVFIWHLFVIRKVSDAGVRGAVGVVPFGLACVVATLAVAAVSFYLVERPALRLGRRLAGRRGYQEAAAARDEGADRPGAPAIELARADPG